MRRLLALIGAATVGAGVVVAIFQLHLIRADKRWLVVPKQQADWHDAFVDIRGWSFRDWANHPNLSRNMVAAGHGDLVTRSATDQFFRGLLEPFRDRGSDNRHPEETPMR
ncbi:MAG: hypothetical protein ACKV0T_03260 [Planctomycetales bacterium]